MLPLDGVLVVSAEHAVAAPFATRQLADLGARVVKIERSSGDFARGYDRTVHGESSHFVWLNRTKESVVLDLRSPDGRHALEALLARADVFVQNLGPGAMDRLGFGPETVRAAHPSLITCSITGFGTGGPWESRRAYDALLQSETGLMSITGTPGATAKAGIPVADIAAGMYAFSGILAALHHRARTGEGATLAVSLMDALAEWMSQPALWRRYSGQEPDRAGGHHASIAPYGPYGAGDGSTVHLAVQNEREWDRLCVQVLEAPGLAADPRFVTNADRVQHRPALDAEILRRLARMAGPELLARLERAEIAHARTRSVGEFLEHEDLAARDRSMDFPLPAGSARTVRPPLDWAGTELHVGPVPGLGEHTAAVLAELATPVDIERPAATAESPTGEGPSDDQAVR
jgi:formyl-CoA transferase